MSENDDILDTYTNDFRGARRGAVMSSEGKTRITIYLDNDVLDHFRKVATAKGRGYQTEINNTLRGVIAAKSMAGQRKAGTADLGQVRTKTYHFVVNDTTCILRGHSVDRAYFKSKVEAEIRELVQSNHHRARATT